jgi:hypothetical protein
MSAVSLLLVAGAALLALLHILLAHRLSTHNWWRPVRIVIVLAICVLIVGFFLSLTVSVDKFW